LPRRKETRKEKQDYDPKVSVKEGGKAAKIQRLDREKIAYINKNKSK